MSDPTIELLRRDRSFSYYWMGQSISFAGSQVSAIALPLVTAIALKGSPAEVGYVATAAMLPYLLFSMVAGHFLEDKPKRFVMISADLAQAVIIGVVPVAWFLGFLTVPLLALIAFLSGTAALCFGVVGFSYVPDLVESSELAAANRAIQGSRTVSEVAGPGAAGVLVGVLGAPVAMAVDAFSYLASAMGIKLTRPPRRDAATETPEQPKAKVPVLTGLRILFKNPYLRALTIHAALYNLAEEVFMINLVLWAVQGQHLSPAAYGVAIGAGGVGALIGTLTALKLSERMGLGKAFLLSLIFSCGTPLVVVLWASHGILLAATIGIAMLIAGIGLGNANIFSLTLRQSVIPKDQLTRSAGAYTQVMYGSIPIGSALAGFLGQTLGTRLATAIGAILLIVSIIPMVSRRIIRLRDTTEATAQ